MKKQIAVGCFVVMVAVASAQIPEPCLNVGGQSSQTSQQFQRTPVRSSAYVPESRLSPMFSYSAYSLGGATRFGPSLTIQATLFRTHSEALDISGGLMFRFRDSSEPTRLDEYSPLGLNPYNYPRTPDSFLRGMRFGMGFAGLEYTWYLTESDIRPYVGAGGMILAWPYEGQVAGSVAPTVKAGVLANVSSGFTGFVEIKRIIGLPFVVGGESPPINNLTGFAFGVSFAPRWN
ncbi:MAG: hypothetical protein WEB37_13530 [Bacteroidota bacterium]